MSSETKSQRETILYKNYVQGCETKIVKFLNLCFRNWGSVKKWRHKYPQYPTFTNEDVVIVEHDGEIVGHSGIHVRDLVFKNRCKVSVALTGDTAVHPDHRGKGIYSQMVKRRLDSVKSRKVSLAFSWVLKGSITYKASIKSGSIEVKQPFLYMKMLRPEKILVNRLKDLFNKNEKFRKTFFQFGIDVSFILGDKKLHLEDLIDNPVEKKGAMQIILSEEALPSILHFRRPSRLRRATTLLYLVLSRKVKVRLSSLSTFLKLIINGISIMKVL